MPLDEKDLAQIAELFKKQQEETIKIIDGKIKPVADTVATITADAKKREEEAKKAKPEEKAPEGKGSADPEVAKLRAKQEELERQVAASEAERKRVAEEAKQQQHLGHLREVLGANGVTGEWIPRAVPYLQSLGVLVEKDGAPAMKFKRSWGEEIVGLKDAIPEWLKTPDGKAYLPPSGANGTGEGAGKRPPNGGSGGNEPTPVASIMGSLLRG